MEMTDKMNNNQFIHEKLFRKCWHEYLDVTYGEWKCHKCNDTVFSNHPHLFGKPTDPDYTKDEMFILLWERLFDEGKLIMFLEWYKSKVLANRRIKSLGDIDIINMIKQPYFSELIVTFMKEKEKESQ